jgi:hypothetical protein
MKNACLKNEVLLALERRLTGQDFKLVKSRDWYVRKNEGVSFCYQIVFYDGNNGYRLSPAVTVRIEIIEEIFHATSGFEKRYQKYTPTIGAEVWRLFNDKQGYQYLLETKDDVDRVVDRLKIVFQDVALPYFSQYSTGHWRKPGGFLGIAGYSPATLGNTPPTPSRNYFSLGRRCYLVDIESSSIRRSTFQKTLQHLVE